MAERMYRVLSAMGPDRPGLVAALSAYVAERGGNLEDSRMAVLGGSFGIMMLVSGSSAALTRLEADAAELETSAGLRVHLEPTAAPDAPRAEARRIQVRVESADREGIVHAIAQALYALGANIVSLDSALYPGAMSGTPLFQLHVVADVPLEVDSEQVESALAHVARDEGLDCVVREA